MSPAHNLWSQLLADIHDPNLQWQLIALGLCVALGWWLSRLLSKRLSAQAGAAVFPGAARSGY